MKRILPAIIIFLALAIVALNYFRLPMGARVDSWITSNETFQVRIDQHKDHFQVPVAGANYVFRSAQIGSDKWAEVMTFRHDDPVPIPREQVRFLNDRVGYLFMGWKYAVTTDGGESWRTWTAEKDLPNWQCCNYGLIKDVRLEANGTGVMILNPIPQRSGEVPSLHTEDYGQHWKL
jgi:hypothetical protein